MQKVTVATHDGLFHADEVYAVTVIKLYLETEKKQLELIRTRNQEIISGADMAIDVGGEYSLAKNRFDHHQKKKPGTHQNGIPYASFGLIWKHFGRKITPNKKVWETIEAKLVSPIDALDNGVNISTPSIKGVFEYGSAQILAAISMAYGDDENSAFLKGMEFAELIIKGEIIKAQAKIDGEKMVKAQIKKQKEPAFLVLEKYISWEVAVSKCKNIKLVIFPDKSSPQWCIQAARDNLDIFGNDRISYPKKWRGLTGIELSTVTEVPDSIFCHTGGFFAVAKTKSAAVELAKKAIAEDKLATIN